MTSILPFKIGFIGGTGFNDPDLWDEFEKVKIDTPFGRPSTDLVCGKIAGIDCAFMPRHGEGHTISPTNVNYRANVYALWKAGARVIVATTACGSFREAMAPKQLVVLKSVIDQTKGKREVTFYDGVAGHPAGVCHIPAHPTFNEALRRVLLTSLEQLGMEHHREGTMICIEGPRFSTKAESVLYRDFFKADLIGMTVFPEAILAKELGLPYASIALVTDYDCWHESEQQNEGAHVDVPSVMAVMKTLCANVEMLVKDVVRRVSDEPLKWVTELEQAQGVARQAVMGTEYVFEWDKSN